MSAPSLVRSSAPAADLLLRDVHLLDPAGGVDGRFDLLIRGGTIAQLSVPGTPSPATPSGGPAAGELEIVEGEGRLYALPAFFDPHVHLRSPGQEHKEDIESGTRAAAAGGYGAV